MPRGGKREGAGRPKGTGNKKLWKEAVEKALQEQRVHGARGVRPAIEHIAHTLVTLAMNGDVSAIREVGDRTDGRPPQAIINEDDETAFRVEQIIRKII